MTATAVAIEELAYHSSSIAAVFDVHCILAGNALLHGTPQQQERWLRPLVAGELVGAFATTEPEASTDLSPKQCRRSPNGVMAAGFFAAASGGSRTRPSPVSSSPWPGRANGFRCSSSTPRCRVSASAYRT